MFDDVVNLRGIVSDPHSLEVEEDSRGFGKISSTSDTSGLTLSERDSVEILSRSSRDSFADPSATERSESEAAAMWS